MSGVLSQFGMKKESTWGTAVTVDKFFRFNDESLSVTPNYHDGAGLGADTTFEPQSHTRQTTRSAGGGVSMDVPTKGFGAIMDLLTASTVTPVQIATTTAYTSTFNIGTTRPNKSATLQVNKPTSQLTDTPFTYPGAVLRSITFSLDVGGVLSCSTDWVAKDETNPTTTPAGAALAAASYIAGATIFPHNEVTLSIGGSAAAAITGVTWTWSQAFADGRFHLGGGGTIAKPIPTGLATVTGTLTGEWYDESHYDRFRSGEFASLAVTATGSTAIEASNFPTFTNTFSAVQFRGSSPTVGGPDLIMTDVPFVAKYNGSTAPWVSTIISTDSAAW